MRLKKILPIAILAAAALLPLESAAKLWESNPKTERTDTRRVALETDLEVRAARGVIVVTTSRPVQVKVFTILGQQISSETIPAGTSQLNVTAHGVYILKIGDLTCKVAV